MTTLDKAIPRIRRLARCLAVLGLTLSAAWAHAQDDVASIPWRTGGFSEVGAGYDMLSGTPMRTVVDFEVEDGVQGRADTCRYFWRAPRTKSMPSASA